MTNDQYAHQVFKKYCEQTGAPIGSDQWKRQPACRCANCAIFFGVAREIGYLKTLENYAYMFDIQRVYIKS